MFGLQSGAKASSSVSRQKDASMVIKDRILAASPYERIGLARSGFRLLIPRVTSGGE